MLIADSQLPGIKVETEMVQYYRAHSAKSPIPFDIYIHNPTQDQWTSAEIGRDGIWHKELCHEISSAMAQIRKKNPQQEIQVLDIGANVGYVSLWSASTDSNVRVTSIEPHPFHNSLLEKTLALPINKQVAKRISLHKVAVGTYTEAGSTMCMRINPTNAAQTVSEKASGEEMKSWPCTHVVVTSLDELLSDSPPIDILKMDVEGYEYRALSGGKQLVMKDGLFPKLIIFEYNYWMLERASEIAPEAWIEDLFNAGYHNITDMGTLKSMTTLQGVKEYFQRDNFLAAIPSSHTDLILRHHTWS